MSNYQFIDLTYLEEMSGGDSATRKVLLQSLLDELDRGVPHLRQLYNAKKWKDLSAACHHMKSTLSFAGNDSMIRANQQLWQFAQRASGPTRQAEAALNFIEAHCRQAKKEIQDALRRS